MILGVMECFVVGVALGFPALRAKGHFFAFVTLAFNLLVFLVSRNEGWLTGGTYVLSGMPRASVMGLSTAKRLPFYYFHRPRLHYCGGADVRHRALTLGARAVKALRENPIRAGSLGVDRRRLTISAFAIGSVHGGMAGASVSSLAQ